MVLSTRLGNSFSRAFSIYIVKFLLFCVLSLENMLYRYFVDVFVLYLM